MNDGIILGIINHYITGIVLIIVWRYNTIIEGISIIEEQNWIEYNVIELGLLGLQYNGSIEGQQNGMMEYLYLSQWE